MRRAIIKTSFTIILVITSASILYCQKIVIPEEIKKKCPEVAFEERVRLAVSEFTKSTSGANSANIENFSSMLSNAMFEVNCFRMLSMQKESSDLVDASRVSDVKPQLLITGEITEYHHKVKESVVVVSKKVSTTAHIGFILQVKDPITKDVLFSKSFNEDGSSDNKSLMLKLPRTSVGGQGSTISTSSSDNIDKAYFDALEKGIIQAVEYIVDCRDKIYAITKSTGDKAIITALNTNFSRLMEIEKALKDLGLVKKIDRSLNNNVGKIEVYYSGKIDEVINILSGKMKEILEITALKDNHITVKFK